MKKFLIFVVLIFVVFLNGCSSDKPEKTTIKFTSWGSQSEIAILENILDDFEKQNPDIKVDFVHIPQNYFQKIHLLFASNLAPDVLFINNYYAPKYIKADVLEDLSPYFKQEAEEKIFFEKALNNFIYNDKLYAIPRDVSNLVVYYNKDLFKKYGTAYPQNNWTINEFIETGKKLTIQNKCWGTGVERNILFLIPFLYSNNTGILDKDGNIIIDKAAEPIQTYADLVNKYHIAPSKSETASLTLAQMFIQQKIAMHISGRWLVPKYREEAKFDWDIINFPAGSNGSVTSIDSSGFAVAKKSKHKRESIKLIKFLTSRSSMEKFAKSGLIVPARKNAAYSNSFLAPDKKPASSIVFLHTIETGVSTRVNENYQRLNDILINALEPVFEGKKTAKEVLTRELINNLNNHKSI